MANRRILSFAALCACFFALGVIALGAFTRLMDAGLGCPDWPGCYGQISVPATLTKLQSYKAWAEMIHRYFVGGLSLFLMGIVLAILCKRDYRVRSNVIFALSLIVLLGYQIVLGRWTVTMKLLPIIVTQHLLGGFLILSILWVIYLNNKQNKTVSANTLVFIPWAILGLILILLQIALGAWTSTNYASLSCADFPFCMNDHPFLPLHLKAAFNLFSPLGINYEGGVLPKAVRQTIQMIHRIGAVIVLLYWFIFSSITIQKLKNVPEILKSLYLILGLLCIQLCIGIANVIYKLPLVSAISHNLVAVILLLSVITFIFNLVLSKRKVA